MRTAGERLQAFGKDRAFFQRKIVNRMRVGGVHNSHIGVHLFPRKRTGGDAEFHHFAHGRKAITRRFDFGNRTISRYPLNKAYFIRLAFSVQVAVIITKITDSVTAPAEGIRDFLIETLLLHECRAVISRE